MAVPLDVEQPSVLVCDGGMIFFLLRYALRANRRDLRIGMLAFLCLTGSVVTSALAREEGRWFSARYDLYVYRIDQLMHVNEPGVALSHYFFARLWGEWTMNFTYGLLAAAVMFLLILYEARPQYREVVLAMLLNLAIAPLVYAAIPVSGPRFAFPNFPLLPAAVAPHLIYLHEAPNGIPSVHFSTAVIIWWYARRWWSGLLLASAFLLFTGIATLASGQHYVLDLILGAIYAGCMIAVGGALKSRTGNFCQPPSG